MLRRGGRRRSPSGGGGGGVLRQEGIHHRGSGEFCRRLSDGSSRWGASSSLVNHQSRVRTASHVETMSSTVALSLLRLLLEFDKGGRGRFRPASLMLVSSSAGHARGATVAPLLPPPPSPGGGAIDRRLPRQSRGRRRGPTAARRPANGADVERIPTAPATRK